MAMRVDPDRCNLLEPQQSIAKESLLREIGQRSLLSSTIVIHVLSPHLYIGEAIGVGGFNNR
jgi:hypothetical protein